MYYVKIFAFINLQQMISSLQEKRSEIKRSDLKDAFMLITAVLDNLMNLSLPGIYLYLSI